MLVLFSPSDGFILVYILKDIFTRKKARNPLGYSKFLDSQFFSNQTGCIEAWGPKSGFACMTAGSPWLSGKHPVVPTLET